MAPRITAAGVVCLWTGALAMPALAANPYPTEAVGDYLFGCMAANGQTRDALKKCACGIDVIASILPYEDYEQASTVLSMQQVRGGGEKMGLFRETQWADERLAELRRAQVEAEVRCFLED